MKTLATILASLAVFAIVLLAAPQPAKAVAPISPEYNSRIIDDGVFINTNAMSAADIQNFLNAQVPSCRPGYTCLKDYRDPVTGKLAAQLIYDEAVAAGLNPRVILVTLQKEQSLVTDDWPVSGQYQKAMGYGCPESQPTCDSRYYGLYNQIHLASLKMISNWRSSCNLPTSGQQVPAELKRGATTNGSVSPYRVDGVSTYIATCATGALYYYTPHRPDTAYISRPAYCPTAGGFCYGNYNFVTIFTRWFGTTWSDPWRAQYVGQSGITANRIAPGTEATVYVEFRNVGTNIWTKTGSTPVRLGTARPRDRASPFVGSSGWLSSSRIAMDQDSVAPGEVARFTFKLAGGQNYGIYQEYFQPLVESVTWMDDWGMYFPFRVEGSTWNSTLLDQTVRDIQVNANGLVTVHYRNSGDTIWEKNSPIPVRLGTDAPHDRVSELYVPGSWLSTTRVPMQESLVLPGQNATFNFWINPKQVKTYSENFQMLAETYLWFGQPLPLTFEAYAPYQSQWVAQSPVPVAAPGTVQQVWVDLRNTGQSTWTKTGAHPVRLGTDSPLDRVSGANDGSWISSTRIDLDQDMVAPGQIGRFTFNVVTPNGTAREYFRPLSEDRTWFGNGREIYFELTGRYVTQYAYLGQSQPAQLAPGQTGTAYVDLRNTGTTTWTKTGPTPFRLGASRPLDRNSPFYTSGNWISPSRVAMDQETVAPGQSARFTFTVTAPSTPGTYNEYFRPLVETVEWLPDIGIYLPLVVTSAGGGSASGGQSASFSQTQSQGSSGGSSPGAGGSPPQQCFIGRQLLGSIVPCNLPL